MRVLIYLVAFVIANLTVLHFGREGLIITSLFLIPFDFVMRCFFHESWKGRKLILKLGGLVCLASAITYLINQNSQGIALGSMFGFIFAQIGAGIFYQIFIDKGYFVKVNGSDLVGIVIDTMIFQAIAFGSIDPHISLYQIALKFIGGLFWYWLLFEKLKIK